MMGDQHYFDGPMALVIVMSGIVLLAAVVNCVRIWLAAASEPDGDDLNTQQLLDSMGSTPVRSQTTQ